MALLFMDSWDHFAYTDITEKWTQIVPGNTGDASGLAAAAGRHGSTALKLGSTANTAAQTNALARVLTPADNTIVLGVAFNSVSAFASLENANVGPLTVGINGTSALVVILHAAAEQCWIRLNTNGTLSAMRSTTVLGTTSAALTAGTFTFVEILLTIHNTAGVVTIRFNGATVLDLASQNTRNGAANAWNEIRFGFYSATGLALTLHYDDLYVLDGTGSAPWNTFLGDCRVDACYPTAAGASAGWTPSAGANYECVDETAPNDDTDYVSTTAVATDTFTVQDAPVALAQVFGVQHCLSAKKTDSGICTIAPVVRQSGVDYVGSDLFPGTSYAYLLGVQATNPATGAQWTEPAFSAAEFGYKRTA